ncbi:hypothetical protein FA15DRAFT_672178 [Coprinopsis marcescibilis]|uniref:Membrane-associated proteins in eicosanoid and glutathione metabolism n=1 Tax=Coprinopsis marcescibilis TaxID=230819 RepID=A0A5C3KNA4_COPMA|nr:hypothetical protein FA15DRAFT_672178 [Coprinopsis marcescibilis]
MPDWFSLSNTILSKLDSPLSLFSIPAVWVTAFYPSFLKTLAVESTVGYDNVAPRGNAARVAMTAGISAELVARIARYEGAHYNGNENLPIWFAAVLAGNFAGLEARTMNTLSIAYVGLRLAFNHVYINQTRVGTSYLRTIIFFSALAIPMTIIFKSANKLINDSNSKSP